MFINGISLFSLGCCECLKQVSINFFSSSRAEISGPLMTNALSLCDENTSVVPAMWSGWVTLWPVVEVTERELGGWVTPWPVRSRSKRMRARGLGHSMASSGRKRMRLGHSVPWPLVGEGAGWVHPKGSASFRRSLPGASKLVLRAEGNALAQDCVCVFGLIALFSSCLHPPQLSY